MNKRRKFLITSLLLSFGFAFINIYGEFTRLLSVLILSIATVVMFSWSLREGLRLDFTLLSLILPFFFTLGVGLFWFLLPSTFYTRIPIIAVYGVGIYALCLTMNIYTVSAIRTIALYRAAKGVGFVLTLFTFFLIYDAILSLRIDILLTTVMVFLSSILIFYQGFWSIRLDREYNSDLFIMSLLSSLVMGEVALVLYFWPVSVVVGSLFYTIAVYILLGLGQAKLENRLFMATVREYLVLGILVFMGMFISTSWGG